MKNELGGKIMTHLAAIRRETYSYLTDDKDENKKSKGTKKFAVKRKPKFENYKHFLEAPLFKNKITLLKKRQKVLNGFKIFDIRNRKKDTRKKTSVELSLNSRT